MAGGLAGIVGAIVIFIVLLVPFVKILHRTGHSGWWILRWFIPVVNLIALWIFAFGRWPAVDGRSA
jgi:Na+/melibiose symporter-like transporter